MRPDFLKRLSQNGFLRNVGLLTGGTVFAQGIAILALPVLTRLYSPEDFDLLAVYTSLLGLIIVGSCLRFNIAIPLPKKDSVAMDLLKLSIASATLISIIIAVPVVIIPERLSRMIGQPEMLPYLWMIPLGGWLASCYDATQYWASRKKRFALITRTRMTRAVGGVGFQVGAGAVSPSPFGLLFGHMIYGGLGLLGLLRSMLRNDRDQLVHTDISQLKNTAAEYRRYPRLSVPEAVFNAAGVEVPILLIAAVAVGPEAGFLMLAIRVMGLPMALVGSSVAQVYLAEAPEKLRDGVLVAFTRETMWRLFQVGAPLLCIAGIVSPFLFPYIFGSEWARAGVIVAWLTPWFILQLVASPVSMVLHVTGNVALSMWLQLGGAIIRIGAVLMAISSLPQFITEIYAISGIAFYTLYIILIFRELRRVTA